MSGQKNKNQKNHVLKNISQITIKQRKLTAKQISNMLNNDFMIGKCMSEIISGFDYLLTTRYDIIKTNGKYILSYDIPKKEVGFIDKIQKMEVTSTESNVYMANIFSSNINVVFKTPKKLSFTYDLMREYYIGMIKINQLRHIVPNFMYTYAMFSYNPPKRYEKIYVMYEKIEGNSLEYLLKNNKLSFQEFIGIYIQILLALEVAQKECNFTHFDLHTSNVIIKKVPKYTYTVVINNKSYIINTTLIPVIIDFGMATVIDNDIIIGSDMFSHYGMMEYMVQGADMYKLLLYSLYYATENIKRQITDLFGFYSIRDPYKIMIKSDTEIKNILKDFGKDVSFSEIASETPLYFLNWIVSSPEYKNYSNKILEIKDRDTYIPISFCKIRFMEILPEFPKMYHSYILTNFYLYLLRKCEYKKMCSDKRKELQKYLNENKKEMVLKDNIILQNFHEIKLPNKKHLQDYSREILNIFINSRGNYKELFNKYYKEILFYDKIQPYLQYFYTIQQLGLENDYREFVYDFLNSKQYLMYIMLNNEIDKTTRWLTTILST